MSREDMTLAQAARAMIDDSDLLAPDETRKQLLFRTGQLAELVLILSMALKAEGEKREALIHEIKEASERRHDEHRTWRHNDK